jgi:hypothetical protein
MKSLGGLILTLLILGISLPANAEELSEKDQAVIAAMMQNDSNGAVIGDVPTCFVSFGIFDGPDGPLLGFFGLFPEDGCENSFQRTDKNGSIDSHIFVHGTFFMIWFNPSIFLGSGGSDIYYRWVRQEDGNSILNVNGTTSDGGKLNIHLSSSSKGNRQDDVIYLENYGYLLGGPKKK